MLPNPVHVAVPPHPVPVPPVRPVGALLVGGCARHDRTAGLVGHLLLLLLGQAAVPLLQLLLLLTLCSSLVELLRALVLLLLLLLHPGPPVLLLLHREGGAGVGRHPPAHWYQHLSCLCLCLPPHQSLVW